MPVMTFWFAFEERLLAVSARVHRLMCRLFCSVCWRGLGAGDLLAALPRHVSLLHPHHPHLSALLSSTLYGCGGRDVEEEEAVERGMEASGLGEQGGGEQGGGGGAAGGVRVVEASCLAVPQASIQDVKSGRVAEGRVEAGEGQSDGQGEGQSDGQGEDQR